MMIYIQLVILLACLHFFSTVNSHGMMLNPVARNSLWRFDKSSPVNYNDNELFCGGFETQHKHNHGICGICGDDYRLPQPRPNENGGKFGEGKVVANYTEGDTITVTILITANHKGRFIFSVCNLDSDWNQPESEDCFQPVYLADGTEEYKLDSVEVGNYLVDVKLPNDFACQRCVFRWHWITGNNWGMCTNQTKGQIGCGPQEEFQNCADISIFPNVYRLEDEENQIFNNYNRRKPFFIH